LVHVNVGKIEHRINRQEGSFPLHKVIDGFMEEFFTRLNASFQTHDTNPSLPRVRIIKNGTRMSAGDMDESNGIYCWDFQITLDNAISLPMRFSADTRRSITSNVLALFGRPRLGVMGVRCISNRNLNPDRGRPRLNLGQRRNTNDIIIRGGLVTCFTDLTVGLTGRARITRTIPGVSLVTETGTEQVVWSNFSYVLTENAFLLFSQRDGAIKNIVSFIRMEEMGQQGVTRWYTNGWASDLVLDRPVAFVRLRQGDQWDRVVTRVNLNIGVAPYTVARGNRDNMRVFEAMGVNLSIAPHTRIGQVSSDTFRGLNMNTMEPDFSRHFAGIMNTTPIGFRRVAEICGERQVTLLANRIGSPIYRTISDFLDNRVTAQVLRRINTNIIFRRGHLLGVLRSATHHLYNMRYTFSDRVTGQRIFPAGNMRMGSVLRGGNLSDNACGWVAAYNAFIELGRFVHPADIIRFIERNNGLILDGLLGTNLMIYTRLFSNWNLRASIITRELNLDHHARRARTAILCYWNPNAPWRGAHYITITWDDEDNEYRAWNVFGNDTSSRLYSSIEAILTETEPPQGLGRRTFIALITIQ